MWSGRYSEQLAASFFTFTFRYISTGVHWITQRKTLNSTHVLPSLWCCTVGQLMTTHLLSSSLRPLSDSFLNNDKDFTSWGKPHIKSLFLFIFITFLSPLLAYDTMTTATECSHVHIIYMWFLNLVVMFLCLQLRILTRARCTFQNICQCFELLLPWNAEKKKACFQRPFAFSK
jgi:hypothetical protein